MTEKAFRKLCKILGPLKKAPYSSWANHALDGGMRYSAVWNQYAYQCGRQSTRYYADPEDVILEAYAKGLIPKGDK